MADLILALIKLSLMLAAVAIKVAFLILLFNCGMSGVKAVSNQCGKTFSIEKDSSFFNGNYFCPVDAP